MGTSTERIEMGKVAVTLTVRTTLTGSTGTWSCDCGLSNIDGPAVRRSGRTVVDTVAMKQTATSHGASCDGTWGVDR